MSNSNTSNGGGLGFCGLLAILFIGLKLGGVIDWSWLWVLSPLWIPVAVVFFIVVVCLLGWLISITVAAGIGWVFDRASRRLASK